MKIRKLDTSNQYDRKNRYTLAPKLIIGYRLISSHIGIVMSMNSYIGFVPSVVWYSKN